MTTKRDVTTSAGYRLTMNEHEGLGFSLGEYQRRYDKVMAAMDAAGIDAMLVRGPENINYLTGYDTPGYYGYHCLVLAAGEQPTLVGRWLEMTNVPEFSWLTSTAPVKDHELPVETTARTVEAMGLAGKRLGVDKNAYFLSVSEFEALQDLLPKATFVDCAGLVEAARVIKSGEEVAMIQHAVDLADKACQAGLDAIAEGVSEDDVAAAVYHTWCASGAEYTGLPNFIVSGPRAAVCHATWRGRRLEHGDPVFLEIAANKFRYGGAVMRCATVGEPTARDQALADATIGALQAVVEAIRPGATCHDVNAVGHETIVKAGFGDYHRHRIGYSIGINYPPDWGEGHILSIRKGEHRALEPNMTFHLVPGCFIYRETGIGFSATVRVTENGCEVLNSLPLELTVK